MNFVFITNVKRLKMKLNSDFVLRTPIKTQENLELTLYSQRADRKGDLLKLEVNLGILSLITP